MFANTSTVTVRNVRRVKKKKRFLISPGSIPIYMASVNGRPESGIIIICELRTLTRLSSINRNCSPIKRLSTTRLVFLFN